MNIFKGKGVLLMDGVEIKSINSNITPERKAELSNRINKTIESRLKRPENTSLFYAPDSKA